MILVINSPTSFKIELFSKTLIHYCVNDVAKIWIFDFLRQKPYGTVINIMEF